MHARQAATHHHATLVYRKRYTFVSRLRAQRQNMRFAQNCHIVGIFLLLCGLADSSVALTITGGYCEKNVSVKYQVPVTKTRPLRHTLNNNDNHNHNNINPQTHMLDANAANQSDSDDLPTEQYVEYEERTRWDTVHICCAGYRTLLFGFCEPICDNTCPPNSYCAEPNKCECLHGYEPSHYPHKQHQLMCRPVCVGGCPEHSHCVAPNRCECRAGYKDTTGWWWFQPVHCERIQCAASDQRYDVERRMCVKIEMSMEELMQKVAEKLANGLDGNEDSDEATYGERELELK